MAAVEPSERQHRGGGRWCPLCLATLTILQQRAVEHATVWLQPICHCRACRPVHPTMTRMPDPSGPQRRSPPPWQPSAAGHAQVYHGTVGSKRSCPQSAHGAHVLLMEPARLGSPVPEVRTACSLPACPAWQLGRPQLPQKSFCHSCSMMCSARSAGRLSLAQNLHTCLMWVMLEQDLPLSIRVGQGTDRTRDMQSPCQLCQSGSSSSTGWEPRTVLCVAAVVGLGQGHGGKAGDWVQVQGDV